MGQNTRAAGLFKTEVTADPQGKAQLKWEKVESWRRLVSPERRLLPAAQQCQQLDGPRNSGRRTCN